MVFNSWSGFKVELLWFWESSLFGWLITPLKSHFLQTNTAQLHILLIMIDSSPTNILLLGFCLWCMSNSSHSFGVCSTASSFITTIYFMKLSFRNSSDQQIREFWRVCLQGNINQWHKKQHEAQINPLSWFLPFPCPPKSGLTWKGGRPGQEWRMGTSKQCGKVTLARQVKSQMSVRLCPKSAFNTSL